MVQLKDFKKAAAAWDSLSEQEKQARIQFINIQFDPILYDIVSCGIWLVSFLQKYSESYNEDFKVYIVQLEKWRNKMVADGYGDLVPEVGDLLSGKHRFWTVRCCGEILR